MKELEGFMMNKSKFSTMVERLVKDKGMSYMDSIIEVCEKNGFEVEDIKKFITPVIKNKIEAEATSLNYLPRQNTLPV